MNKTMQFAVDQAHAQFGNKPTAHEMAALQDNDRLRESNIKLADRVAELAARNDANCDRAKQLNGRCENLRALNAELVAALEYWCPVKEPLIDQFDQPSTAHRVMWQKARAALTKAGA